VYDKDEELSSISEPLYQKDEELSTRNSAPDDADSDSEPPEVYLCFNYHYIHVHV
jgi:hypothetical protein